MTSDQEAVLIRWYLDLPFEGMLDESHWVYEIPIVWRSALAETLIEKKQVHVQLLKRDIQVLTQIHNQDEDSRLLQLIYRKRLTAEKLDREARGV